MIMTFWWSKATKLLEFSRSVSLDLRTRIFCDQDEEEEDRGIAYSSYLNIGKILANINIV